MKSREFFTIDQNPEEEEDIAKLEQKSFERILRRANTNEQENKSFQEALAKINFEDLKEMFSADAARSGIDENALNFVEPDTIINTKRQGEQPSADAYYYMLANRISLDYEGIKECAAEANISPELYLLHVIAHEETHAVSKVSCQGMSQIDRKEINQAKIKTGYKDDIVVLLDAGEKKKYFHKDSFFGFDEGITEKYAREEIMYPYLEKHKDFSSKEDIENLKASLSHKDKNGFYKNEIVMVDAFIRALSRSTGFDTETIWKGMIHGKFSGNTLNENGTYKLVEKMIGMEILDNIKNLDINNSEAALFIAEQLDKSDVAEFDAMNNFLKNNND